MDQQLDEQKVLQLFLEQWNNPSEIAKESDLGRGQVVQLLERNNIEATPVKGREEQVRFRDGAEEPSYLTEDIDGKYIAEDEVPALEDYVDGLANRLETDEIAEVVNNIYGEGTVETEEINDYLTQRKGAGFIGPNDYELRPADRDDLMRVRGLYDVLSAYHDNLDQIVEGVQEGDM